MENNKDKMAEFQAAAAPLIKWLNDNGNPHHKIIVECNGAELVSGEIYVPVKDYIKD